jgi:hypothetical protein
MIDFNIFNKTKYTFEGKKEGEDVVLYLHRHWWTLANKILGIMLAALLPFLIIMVFGRQLIEYNIMPFFAFLWASFYLVLWFLLFYILTIYNLNSWIVTNMRIIDQHQRGFFNQEVAELSHVNIQDVSFKMEGMIATMMNYGWIEVQTAGNDQKFLFTDIPNPQFVKDEIMKIAAIQKGHNGVFNPVEKQAPTI